MKVAVYDTHVTGRDGNKLHFDILVPSGVPVEKVLDYGKQYLKQAGADNQPLSARECQFCHVEEPGPAAVESILTQGYHIEKIEGFE